MTKIKPRERDALLQALRSGVVPRVGQHLIQVGRKREIEAMVKDLGTIADGGTSFRLVIGEYGSGKTFFLNLVRAVALEKKLVTMHADLTPERRLHATGGQARSLFAELMKNLSTRTKPDGGALAGIIERFIANAKSQASAKGLNSEDIIRDQLAGLVELVNGFDFVEVVAAYCRGFETGQEQLKSDALRWLRGEYSTKTEARQALKVRTIIDDASFYDQLVLLSRFVTLAGYSGLLVCLDEMVNLYKLGNTQARNSNYEQILRILNDTLQGNNQGLGFIMGGTPEFLMDMRRGLYSYAALQSRLAENTFAQNGLVDFTHPVLRLLSLSQEEFYLLLHKLRHVYTNGGQNNYILPDEALAAFMEHCNQRIGDYYFRTPRTTITAFINLLAVLDQNEQADWQELLGKVPVERDMGFQNDAFFDGLATTENMDVSLPIGGNIDELASFKLQ